MIESYKRYWTNIVNFSGTSDRPDYWWPVVINAILGAIIGVVLQAIFGHPGDYYTLKDIGINSIYGAISVLLWLANWSVKVRRLHDTNRSGWWILIEIIPIIGDIWMFVLLVLPTNNDSRWSN
ncbi:DUF805 domain-containing protein [Lentilactobacillus kribbianus]|uniref:DUF805 domain-containing protein n=1 Tax=Lentilactobacillus kribbianus TaxID=2729622 RepID=UPI001557620D|nr:DUF805 domain-containing protein [Lentilactobacillus kribbianus]